MEKTSLNYIHLLPDLAPRLTLSSSNYLCLEQFAMVQKMFGPLKFHCILKFKVMFCGRGTHTSCSEDK